MSSITKEEVPHILQNEEKNCGITCLEMMFKFFEEGSVGELIERGKKWPDKISIYDLCELSKELGYKSKSFKISKNNIEGIPTPFIAFMEYEHYINVWDVRSQKILISDPSDVDKNKFVKRETFIGKWTKGEVGMVVLTRPQE